MNDCKWAIARDSTAEAISRAPGSRRLGSDGVGTFWGSQLSSHPIPNSITRAGRVGSLGGTSTRGLTRASSMYKGATRVLWISMSSNHILDHESTRILGSDSALLFLEFPTKSFVHGELRGKAESPFQKIHEHVFVSNSSNDECDINAYDLPCFLNKRKADIGFLCSI